MHRKHHRQLPGEPPQLGHDGPQTRLVIHIRGPMQSDISKRLALQSELFEVAVCPRLVQIGDQRVNHDVAHEFYFRFGHAFSFQIFVGVRGRSQKEIGQRIRYDPVDLLGHCAVEAAQAGFHVGHFDPQL